MKCEGCQGPTRFLESLDKYAFKCDNCYADEEKRKWRIINSFTNKLRRIGIHVELAGNYPWIYLDKVNGIQVRERFEANHGFTAFYLPVKNSLPIHFSDTRSVFQKIREMLEHPELDITRRLKQDELNDNGN